MIKIFNDQLLDSRESAAVIFLDPIRPQNSTDSSSLARSAMPPLKVLFWSSSGPTCLTEVFSVNPGDSVFSSACFPWRSHWVLFLDQTYFRFKCSRCTPFCTTVMQTTLDTNLPLKQNDTDALKPFSDCLNASMTF